MVGAEMLPSPPTEIIKQLNTGVDNSGDGPWTSGLVDLMVIGPGLYTSLSISVCAFMTFRNYSVLQCIIYFHVINKQSTGAEILIL